MREIKTLKYIIIVFSILIFAAVGILIYRYDDSKELTASKKTGLNIPTAIVYINGNEDDFFGYERGILVPGKLFDEYKAAHNLGDDEIPTMETDANFNHKEWVRECSVMLVSSDGKIILNDKAGARISGNASRKLAQKSLTILADKKYGSKDSHFYMDLGDGNKQYDRFRIHSGGQDLRDTQLRDQLINYMALKCGFEIIRPMVPTLIYINDEFYGVGHIEPKINEDYIGEKYGITKKYVEVFDQGGINEALEHIGYENIRYNFENEQFRDEFESKVDTDSFIKYIAFNFMLRNYDWPVNNVLIYRYTGNTYRDDCPLTDGKYRFAPTDVDVSLKSDKGDPFSIMDFLEDDENMRFMKGFLEYAPYREKFVNTMLDFIAVGLSDDVLIQLQCINAEYGDAFAYALENTKFDDIKTYLLNRDASLAELFNNIINRRQQLYDHLYQYYNTGEGYVLMVYPGEDKKIKVSNIIVDDSYYEGNENVFTSVRACSIPTNIFVSDKNGNPLSYIYINGEKKELVDGFFAVDASMAADGTVVVN